MTPGAHFQILGSSSSGNCGLLITPQAKILIDAGFSGKRICQMLTTSGYSIDEIDAIFLTHEHSDHSQGFRGLNKFENITWISNRDTRDAIQHPAISKVKWSVFETGSRFVYKNLEIEAFSIPHDANDPVGYVFSWGGDDLFDPYHSIAWILDLGYVTELVKEKIQVAQTLVIEANYDTELLETDTKRPWSVKQRIQSRHGHLSNKATVELLGSISNDQLQSVYLAHLSKDCNSLRAIRKAFAPLLEHSTLPFKVNIFHPEEGKNIEL